MRTGDWRSWAVGLAVLAMGCTGDSGAPPPVDTAPDTDDTAPDTDTDDTGGDTDTEAGLNFDNALYSAFYAAQCVDCHAAWGTSKAEVYEGLLTMTTRRGGRSLITPGSPEESIIYLKLLEDVGGTYGKRMPMVLSEVTKPDQQAVYDWIAAGAEFDALFLGGFMSVWDDYQCEDCHREEIGEEDANEVYQNLMAGSVANYAYVVPGSPEESLVYLKITSPPYGQVMPIWFDYLPDETIEAVRQWIEEGAVLE